jgi:hypothetical protein
MVRLVHCNDDYLRIGMNITRNTRSWDKMTIHVHSFGDNTEMFGKQK